MSSIRSDPGHLRACTVVWGPCPCALTFSKTSHFTTVADLGCSEWGGLHAEGGREAKNAWVLATPQRGHLACSSSHSITPCVLCHLQGALCCGRAWCLPCTASHLQAIPRLPRHQPSLLWNGNNNNFAYPSHGLKAYFEKRKICSKCCESCGVLLKWEITEKPSKILFYNLITEVLFKKINTWLWYKV